MTQAQHFDYLAEANATASNKFYGEVVAMPLFHDVLRDCITSLSVLDKFKKAMFYGRELPAHLSKANYPRDVVTLQRAPVWLGNDDAQGIAILHSIIGMATEACELLEMLRDSVVEGVPFDPVHFGEEMGDSNWYAAVGLKAIGSSFDEMHRANIAKLRHRFPDAYTEHDANNRDLIGERKALEQQPEQPLQQQAEVINKAALRGLKIEVSGPSACGKTVAVDMIKRLIPNANVVEGVFSIADSFPKPALDKA